MHITGTITKLVTQKNFGFIERQGVDYFFHMHDLLDGANFNTLATGQRVTFEEAESVKGPRAKRVSVDA